MSDPTAQVRLHKSQQRIRPRTTERIFPTGDEGGEDIIGGRSLCISRPSSPSAPLNPAGGSQHAGQLGMDMRPLDGVQRRRSLVSTGHDSQDAYRFSPDHAGVTTNDHFDHGMEVNGKGRRRSLVSAANFNQATTASQPAPAFPKTFVGGNVADHLDHAMNVASSQPRARRLSQVDRGRRSSLDHTHAGSAHADETAFPYVPAAGKKIGGNAPAYLRYSSKGTGLSLDYGHGEVIEYRRPNDGCHTETAISPPKKDPAAYAAQLGYAGSKINGMPPQTQRFSSTFNGPIDTTPSIDFVGIAAAFSGT